MKFTLPAKLLKAAQRFQAVKDHRRYLGGIHVTPSGTVRASNGRVLIDGKLNEPVSGLDRQVIIRLSGKAIPKKARLAHLVIDPYDDIGYCTFTDRWGEKVTVDGFVEIRSVELLQPHSVDFDRVICHGVRTKVDSMGVDLGYLAVVWSALKDFEVKSDCQIDFFGTNQQMQLKPLRWNEDLFSVKFIVMPARL
jgi:hypothetical protein